jgi:hypothetical protein
MDILSLIIFLLINVILIAISLYQLNTKKIYPLFSLAIAYSILSIWVFFIASDLDKVAKESLWCILMNDKYYKIHFLLSATAIVLYVLNRLIKRYIIRIILPAMIYFIASMMFFTINNFGIIYFVWFTIFSVALTAYLYSILTYSELDKIFETKKKKAIGFVKEESTRNFRLGIQGLLALAASTGVSMSIIFRDGEISWHDNAILYDAFGMAIGLVIVCIGLGLFLFVPHFNLREKLYQFYIPEESEEKPDEEPNE